MKALDVAITPRLLYQSLSQFLSRGRVYVSDTAAVNISSLPSLPGSAELPRVSLPSITPAMITSSSLSHQETLHPLLLNNLLKNYLLSVIRQNSNCKNK